MIKFVCISMITLVMSVTGWASSQAADCEEDSLSRQQVLDFQAHLFDALGQENRTAWDALVAPNFIAFERGKQFSSSEFFGLLEAAHRNGIQLMWSVTEPRIETDNKLAVMSYVNVGSIAERGAAPMPQRWLETVTFRRDGLIWRAVMVTSMRIEPPH